MNVLSKLLLGVAAIGLVAGLSLPAKAGDPRFDSCSMPAFTQPGGGGYKFNQVKGDTLALTASVTQDSVNFGFEADAVMLVVQAPNDGGGAWFRLGTTLTDSLAVAIADPSGMTVVATSAGNFITGGSLTRGGAFPIVTAPVSPVGAAAVQLQSLSTTCVWLPVKTRGIIAVHGAGTLSVIGTSNSTVHVTGFNQAGTE